MIAELLSTNRRARQPQPGPYCDPTTSAHDGSDVQPYLLLREPGRYETTLSVVMLCRGCHGCYASMGLVLTPERRR